MSGSNQFSRAIAVVIAATLSFLAAGSMAGNLKLTISGYATPIDVLSFSIGATRGTVVNYQDFNFTAVESALTPLLLGWTSSGFNGTTAVLQVLSASTSAPISDWTLTGWNMTSTQVGGASTASSSTAGAPTTNVSMKFTTITYRVFAADGTVAQRTCWNVSTKLAC
jgi:type VI protein secretion system component Hcp